ncbi:hypothetical protein [Mycolicibacterium mengxianglii]|uniref:hypothetical protein n=1 Tax=Mycolicibacterium mengxianglii TaxID=2736649 RepID=UPI0018EEFB03|nr:hypothetical protein [Mycolicibacterium mengxianglii]
MAGGHDVEELAVGSGELRLARRLRGPPVQSTPLTFGSEPTLIFGSVDILTFG